MVSRAEKFLALGLARSLPNVDSDDLPDDTVTINSISVTLPISPLTTPSTVDVDITNNLSQQLENEVIGITADGVLLGTKQFTLSSSQSKTISLDVLFITAGEKTVEATAGQDSASTTVNIGLLTNR